MPIQVQGPDGQMLEFPDGTDRDTMRAAMAKRYGGPSQQAQADFSRVTGGPMERPEPPEPSFVERETRGLGLGARAAMQGIGGLVGAVGGDAFNKLIPGDQPSYRDAAGMLADRIGLPQPQNSRERVLGNVGEALTGTAATMGGGGALAQVPGAVGRVGAFLSAQPGLQAVSSATGAGAAGVTREQGGSQAQQLAAGLIGGLAPGVSGMGLAATARGVIRGQDGTQMQRAIDDFSALGATPSAGQASGNRLVQGAENVLSGGPTSAGVMNRFAERQAEDIGEGLQNTATGLTRNASAERAGRAVERGVDVFAGNTAATKRALYWQADQFIPEQTPVGLSNTWQEVVRLTTPTPGAQATTGAMIQPTILRLRDNLAQDIAAGGGQIPYSALKQIRSEIGEAISNSSPLIPTSDLREMRRLYASLSRDMESAAQTQGPEAVRAARRANNYTRAVADRLEQVKRVVDKNGGPERVFEAAMAGTRDGGTTLRAVMQSLPREGQQALTGAVIKRMGMATPGAQDASGDVFSAATFLTNWNRVSPEAKRALFDRHGPEFSQNMDRIARVASNIKDGAKVFANPSGTANRAAAMTYGAALVGSMFTGGTGGLVASGIGANALARMMTSPRAVKWLARTTNLPIGSIPGALNAMRAEGDREDDEVLIELADLLGQSQQENPQSGADQQR